MRNTGGQLTERGHLLRLDQIGLRGLQVAISGFGGVAGGADIRLAPLAFGDIAINQHDTAVRHWVMSDLYHGAVGAGSVAAVMSAHGAPQALDPALRVYV